MIERATEAIQVKVESLLYLIWVIWVSLSCSLQSHRFKKYAKQADFKQQTCQGSKGSMIDEKGRPFHKKYLEQAPINSNYVNLKSEQLDRNSLADA